MVDRSPSSSIAHKSKALHGRWQDPFLSAKHVEVTESGRTETWLRDLIIHSLGVPITVVTALPLREHSREFCDVLDRQAERGCAGQLLVDCYDCRLFIVLSSENNEQLGDFLSFSRDTGDYGTVDCHLFLCH
jgi:hypothetical protein